MASERIHIGPEVVKDAIKKARLGSTKLRDFADVLQPYLPTRYWLSFVDLFRDPILWHGVLRGVAVQGAYLVVFAGVAWANFSTKDISS